MLAAMYFHAHDAANKRVLNRSIIALGVRRISAKTRIDIYHEQPQVVRRQLCGAPHNTDVLPIATGMRPDIGQSSHSLIQMKTTALHKNPDTPNIRTGPRLQRLR